MLIFFLLFAVFAVSLVFRQPIARLTRASNVGTPSAQQTRVFAWPLSGVKADGRTWSTITVIVRNEETKPVEGKPVTLETTLGTVQEPSILTNSQGMAIFQLTSDTPGIAEVTAVIDNSVRAVQQVTVEFAK